MASLPHRGSLCVWAEFLWDTCILRRVHFSIRFSTLLGFPSGSVVKNLPAKAGDTRDVRSIPGSGRSYGGGNGNPLQYSCLENPMDRGAWQVMVHGVAKSQTRDTTKRLSVHTPYYCPPSALEVGSSKCVLKQWTAGRRPDSQTSWSGGPWTNGPSARKSSNTRPPGWLWGCCLTASYLLPCNQTSYSCLFLSSCFDLPAFRMISFTMSSCPFSS